MQCPVWHVGCSTARNGQLRSHKTTAGQEGGQLLLHQQPGHTSPKTCSAMCRSVMMCAGAAAVRPQTEHFGCRAEGDWKKQGEMETKLHWISWMQPPVHHHTGDRRALPALWDNRAQGLQRGGWCGKIESAEFLKPSGIFSKVPEAGGSADIAGVQCQGPREQETWAAHKQIPFSSRVNAS